MPSCYGEEEARDDQSHTTVESVEERKASQSKAPTKKMNADASVKKLLRAFRKEMKDQFIALYGKKYYHWVDETCRRKLKDFFTTTKELIGNDGSILDGHQFS